MHLEIFEESNNAAKFQGFLIGLKNRCQGRRVLVVLDNLRIHHSKLLDGVFDHDFKPMYLPPYSCELNPIETLWAVVKKKWTQELQVLAELFMNLKPDDITKRIIEQLRSVICK